MSQVRPAACVLLFVFVLLTGAGSVSAEPVPLLAHRAHLKFDTTTNHVLVQDEVTLPAGLTELRLGAGFEITKMLSRDNASLDIRTVVEQAEDEDGPYQRLIVQRMGLRNGGMLRLSYAGTFHEAVDEVVFSRENVGGEITATISEEGIYLSSSAEWLPMCCRNRALALSSPAAIRGRMLIIVWSAPIFVI